MNTTTMSYKSIERHWKQRRAKIMKMLQRGMSQSEVARAFGVSRQRIHQVVRREAP